MLRDRVAAAERRNGTPRQPLLVPSARARVRLKPHVPPCCLEGLEQFGHCWLLFAFHLNTGAFTKPGAPFRADICTCHDHAWGPVQMRATPCRALQTHA